MAMPAEPAMPTQEYSSAWKTFSMSRWAMTLPIVARRSPAITTPVVWVTATMVVPCGASRVTLARASARLPGKRSGARAPRKSANELLAGAKNAAGSLPPSRRSMRSPCHTLRRSRRAVTGDNLEDHPLEGGELLDRRQDRKPMPPQVVDQSLEHDDVVARVAQCLVAVEAEDAADPAGRVVVIDVLG